MTDKEFMEEVRARTGELPGMIYRSLDRVYRISEQELIDVERIMKEVVELVDSRQCDSSEKAVAHALGLKPQYKKRGGANGKTRKKVW